MNQYRCETCKHYHDEIEDTYGMCYAEKAHREQLYNNVYDHLARYGCASHSDFQADREKALDKLHKWFENYCEGNEEPDLWMAFLHAERGLRQSKDGEP
jgi:hypothetical protein